MLEHLKIQGYRGLDGFEMRDCTRFNLIVGPNNSGKTSLLEALFIHLAPANLQTILAVIEGRLHGFRIDTQYILENLRWLFTSPEGKEGKDRWEMVILSMIKREQRYTKNSLIRGESAAQLYLDNDGYAETYLFPFTEKKITGNPVENRLISPPMIHVLTISPYKHTEYQAGLDEYSQVVKLGLKEKLLEFMRKIDSNIQDVSILLSSDRTPGFYVQHKALGSTPINNLGDGIRRLFYLISCFVLCSHGVLLVDELETAVHTSALQGFMDWLMKASEEFDTQIFATTHSLECIDAVIRSSLERKDYLTLYRLFGENGKVMAHRIDQDTLKTGRFELGLEVR